MPNGTYGGVGAGESNLPGYPIGVARGWTYASIRDRSHATNAMYSRAPARTRGVAPLLLAVVRSAGVFVVGEASVMAIDALADAGDAAA